MSGYLWVVLLLVVLAGRLVWGARRRRWNRNRDAMPAPARAQSGERFTSRGKVLRTAGRRSLLYWRRGWPR